jgi:periplasmic protein TonB
MEIKKHPLKELDNYSKLFFQIGLALTMFIIYVLVEHKSYDKIYVSGLGDVNMTKELEEDIPIVNIKVDAPPPKNTPVVVEKIKIVEDELKIEETIVQSTETDENQAIVVNTEDIVEVEEEEEVIEDIPFLLIQDVPVFPGCEGNNEELKKCFSQKIQLFFSKKFNIGLSSELGLSEGKKRLYVVFRIDNKGNVVNVKCRGPHPVLEKEVIKIISTLPQMQPGKQRGKPVGVSYSIPITFEIR